MSRPTIVIRIDGGLVTQVHADGLPTGTVIVTVDYDTDGATPEDDDTVSIIGDGDAVWIAAVEPAPLDDADREAVALVQP